MSATNRGAKRMAFDFYPTPEKYVHSFLRKWKPEFLPNDKWLEPCAGNGAIIRAVNDYCSDREFVEPEWTAVEIQSIESIPRQTTLRGNIYAEWHQPQDFLTWQPNRNSRRKQFDVAISNPPFEIAMPIIEHSMELAHEVAMLLRLDYLGSQERADFHEANPADLYKLRSRPAFINGKTDSCEYAWFVWSDRAGVGGRWFMLDL